MDFNRLQIGDTIKGQIGIFADDDKVIEEDIKVDGIVSKVTRKAVFYTRPDGTQGRAGRQDCKGGLLFLMNNGQKQMINLPK